MFAIVNIAGKQYRVAQGDQVKVSSLEIEAGKKVKFDQVLLTDDGKKVQVGTPTLKGVTVSGTVLNHGRDRKVIIFKKKRRKGYRRKNGHRQNFSLVQIDTSSVLAPKKKSSQKKKVKPAKKKED